MENLLTALSSAGGTLADIAYTRILVASSRREDLGAVWSVIRTAFADHEVPSTLLGVTVLGYENQLVEIEAVAAVTERHLPTDPTASSPTDPTASSPS